VARGTLTEKHKRFVEAYCGPAAGNATKAAEIAGVPHRSASTMGARWLGKVWIQKAIADRQDRREKKSIADADERDEILTKIARRGSAASKDRIAAVKELNKVSGRHTLNVHHSGTLTLEQLLTESRETGR